MVTIVLLVISNVFMTFAWYYHLKHPDLKNSPLWIAIAASWGIALLEYCFMVPANRIGAQQSGFSVSQLKIIQEAITLGVFLVFVKVVMGERLGWNQYAGFALVLVGVAMVFGSWSPSRATGDAPRQAPTSEARPM